MRLLSITVHNYRIHRELHVELHASRTIIGGPNEAGKSTLAKAAHRALFLKAKITGETQKSMVSDFYPGHPEVAVSFQAGGREYKIQKRFSGTTGTAALTETGGPTWHGDEAESRLAELLGVQATGGGRGAGERAAEQWAHLWVWQGKAGGDPTGHANDDDLKDTLLARLQDSAGAGAAVMQSELDARVAGNFAEAHEGIFNKNGSPLKNSELGRALEATAIAKQVREEAGKCLKELQGALDDFEDAENAIRENDDILPGLVEKKKAAEERLAQVAELKSKEQSLEHAANAASECYDGLKEADKKLQNIRGDIQNRATVLEPRQTEIKGLEKTEEALRIHSSEVGKQYDEAIEAVTELRARRDLADACVGLFEAASRQDQLKEMLVKVQSLRTLKGGVETELARLPLVTSSQVENLRKLEKSGDKAEASLAAMAAGIEVVASNVPVKAGDEILEAGSSRVLTEDTEINIGQSITLRIKPGGGTSLMKARGELQDASREFQSKLAALGVESMSDASFACAQRESLEGKIAGANRELDALRAESIEKELSNAGNSVEEAKARISRLADSMGSFAAPKDEAEAKGLLNKAERKLSGAQNQEKGSKIARDDAAKEHKNAERKLKEHRESVQEESRELEQLRGGLSQLLSEHGEDEQRREKLNTLLEAKNEKSRLLGAARSELDLLQPSQQESDRRRFQMAIGICEKNIREAEDKRLRSRTLLQTDGIHDPQEEYIIAEAHERAAIERQEQARRDAESIKRLHELFIAEKRALSERFTGPLAEKVSGYLRCLFGIGARAKLTMEENEFERLSIERSADSVGAFGFDALSGGTQEQVAAAFRLGMAEVLASDHDGCLPVVFDDAFAYSDPERVQTLQRMLYLATDRGIQVIVLTCNPADYAGLGAKQIMLRSEKPPMRRSPLGTTNGNTEEMPASEESEDPTLISTLTPVTEEQRTAFIAALEAEGGSKGNIRLRQILGWDEATYEAAKRDLRATGRLSLGKGKGGSVALT